MKYSGVFILLILMVSGCETSSSDFSSAKNLIPKEAYFVAKINDLNDFLNRGSDHPILPKLFKTNLETVRPILSRLSTTNSVYTAFLKSEDSLDDHLIITEFTNSVLSDSTTTLSLEESGKITTIEVDSSQYYINHFGEFLLLSNSRDLIDPSNLQHQDKALSRLWDTSSEDVPITLLFNETALNTSKLVFSPNDKNSIAYSYTSLDLNYGDDWLLYNGVATGNDSLTNYLDVFKGTTAQKLQSTAVIPSSVKSFTSIAFDDYTVFETNRRLLLKDTTDIRDDSFLPYVNEIARTDNLLILFSLNPEFILESIEGLTNVETYRNVDLFSFSQSDFFQSKFLPFFKCPVIKYLAPYDNYIIMANSKDAITSALSDVLSNKVLSKSNAFKTMSTNLSDQASLFVYKNAQGISQHLDLDLKSYDANAVGVIYEKDYAHINGVIQKYEAAAASNTVTEDFSVSLKTYILNAPQLVKNHVTKGYDIAVQDIENNLHLISNSGKTLWIKKLQGNILGDIKQIDMYKNGRLQMAFATSKRLYVIDRNGNDVAPFPLNFKDDITQPLSVFDYDNTKNYRLLITQGKDLLMYDAKGKRINGFKYTQTASDISSQPKHFRIGSKDYIAFKAGEVLKILNRQGNIRVKVNKRLLFSDNELFLYQNQFTTTDTLGQLIQVNNKGQLSQKDLKITPNHNLMTTSKTLVTLTENRLNIKSKSIDLDYGDYTVPQIFYLNDKIYVSTTDLQAKKVYLFDSQAKSIPGFPVYGTSASTLQNLDNKRGLELVTQGDDKSIIVYNLN